MSHLWPEVPHDQPAYADLPTDFWPWPEVLSDVTQRPNLSAALEVRQDGRRARLLWANGEPLGVHGDTGDTDPAALMLSHPRAHVSLYLLDPSVARMAWMCRNTPPEHSPYDWATLRGDLVQRGFTGIVRSGAGDSYWQSGRILGGPEPLTTERVSLLTPPVSAIKTEDVIDFYTQALAAAETRFNVEPVWRAVALELADDHPCLDPFAREVVYENRKLALHASIPTSELLPALKEAFLDTLRRGGTGPALIPLDPLRQHPLWSVSGLGGH